MSLEDCGTSNSRDMHKALVGEKIVASFPDDEGRFWIVCESGYAIVFGSLGVNAGGPVYWRESPAKVAAVIAKRREDIGRNIRELSELGSIGLGADHA